MCECANTIQRLVSCLWRRELRTRAGGLHGDHINLFIEEGPALGPVLEVAVDNLDEAKQRLVENGCEIVKDEPDFPRCYVKDPFGLIYNLKA